MRKETKENIDIYVYICCHGATLDGDTSTGIGTSYAIDGNETHVPVGKPRQRLHI